MRSIVTLCRRGTSTILGTIIFVGIMFTAVIPMLLVMRQADIFHEMRKHELELFDEAREIEDLHVYVFPATGSSPSNPILTLRVENRGNLAIKIVKTWINDDPHPEEDFVNPMSYIERDLDYYDFASDSYYFIKVTTDRGNIFSSDSGSVFCTSGGIWECELFTINFLISYPEGGKFDVTVSYADDEYNIGDTVPGGEFEIHKSAVGPAYDFLHVTISPQKYHIRITKRNGPEIYSRFKDLEWPGGPSVIWVFA